MSARAESRDDLAAALRVSLQKAIAERSARGDIAMTAPTPHTGPGTCKCPRGACGCDHVASPSDTESDVRRRDDAAPAPTGPEPEERAGDDLPLHIADLLYAATAEGPLLRDESYDLAVQILAGIEDSAWLADRERAAHAAGAAQVSALQADVAQLAADRDSLRKAGEEMERQRDEVRAERDTYRSVIEAYEAGVAQIEAERDEALRMLARHQSEESARWMPAVRERNAMRPVVEAAVAWSAMRAGTPTKPKPESLALLAAVEKYQHPLVTVALPTHDAPSDPAVTPQSDENGSGVAQDVPEALGAQKGARGAGDRPPVVWRHSCGWEQVSPIPARCPSCGGDKAWGGRRD